MKVSLFGYNRRETDDYCKFLTDSNSSLLGEIKQLKAKTEELERRASEYKNLDELNKQELDILKSRIEEYEANEAGYK